jgi:AP-1 complex subunit gamma-1
MSCTLADLIADVRACKTAEAERARINEECALIRTAIKDEGAGKGKLLRVGMLTANPFRERNMLKLLFVHMLGYSTHWAQMECVTMIASPKFHEKRIGYLGLMLLLDETTEVLTLVTHQLSRDLEDENPLVNSLALTTLANISSAEMIRDLQRQIDKHLTTGSALTRKKAALVCIRLFKTSPDLIEESIPRVVSLLTDRTHATIMTGTALMWHMAKMKPSIIPRFAKTVPHLVKLLRKLVTSSNVPNYTIGGVCDPFLQSKLLNLLRVLGHGNREASGEMNDVLALVATHTDASRTAGNAILYDAVQCILDVEAEAGLRVLAVNILGRFLLNDENNIRYVALTTLCNIVDKDLDAVARHRGVIVNCLRDPDTSIRRRALDLVYALTTSDNVVEMAGEMVNYAVIAEPDERPVVCSRVAAAAKRFAPSVRWEVDVLLVLIATRGEDTKRDVVRRLIYLLTSCKTVEERASLAHKTTEMLLENRDSPDCQAPLLMAAAWVIGEYAALLVVDPPELPVVGATIIPVGPRGKRRTYGELAEMLQSMLLHHKAGTEIKGVALTALAKLSSHLSPADPCFATVRSALGTFATSLNTELQSRSVEFLALTSLDLQELWPEVLAPVPTLTAENVKRMAIASDRIDVDADATTSHLVTSSDDLTEGAGMVKMATSGATREDAEAVQRANALNSVEEDSLSDLFGTVAVTAGPALKAAALDLDSLFGSGAPMGGAPMGGAPMGGTSMGGAPMGGAPMGGAPMGGTPMGGAPMSGAPMGGAPMSGAPMGGAPMRGAPMGGTPMGGAPMGGAPMGGTPMGGTSMGGTPMGGTSMVSGSGGPLSSAGKAPRGVFCGAQGPVSLFAETEAAPAGATNLSVTLFLYYSPTAAASGEVTDVVVETAVAKYMSQVVGTQTGKSVGPANVSTPGVTRTVTLTNPQAGAKPFKLLVRAQFTGEDGTKATMQVDVTKHIAA